MMLILDAFGISAVALVSPFIMNTKSALAWSPCLMKNLRLMSAGTASAYAYRMSGRSPFDPTALPVPCCDVDVGSGTFKSAAGAETAVVGIASNAPLSACIGTFGSDGESTGIGTSCTAESSTDGGSGTKSIMDGVYD